MNFFGFHRKWINDSWHYYEEMSRSREAKEAGVANVSCYAFANSRPQAVRNAWLEGLLPIYRLLNEDEFDCVSGKWKYGAYYTTLITQGKYYLPWARNKLKENGVTLTKKRVNSLEELKDDYGLIINCAGLGSRELCNDKRLVPIRGQATKIHAPWVKACFYGELDTYVIPGLDGDVTLGGSRGYDSENMNICPYEAAAMYNRCTKLLPSIVKAKILGHAAGLRPHRENNVRVETEKITNGLSSCIVVHNYGHGGYGVCTAPGTAKYAVNLAKMVYTASGSKL